jgi:hypothetical protein
MSKLIILLMTVVISTTVSARPGGHGGGHYGGYSGSRSSHTSSGGYGVSTNRTHVSGYVSKSGKYVAPHDRTSKDGTRNNNWSTKGNRNPDTGKAGTKPRD